MQFGSRSVILIRQGIAKRIAVRIHRKHGYGMGADGDSPYSLDHFLAGLLCKRPEDVHGIVPPLRRVLFLHIRAWHQKPAGLAGLSHHGSILAEYNCLDIRCPAIHS